jgi:hypothetical protein
VFLKFLEDRWRWGYLSKSPQSRFPEILDASFGRIRSTVIYSSLSEDKMTTGRSNGG